MAKLIREQSLLLGHSGSHLTWKAFRAGHATLLAIKGASIGNIMQAGEWKSKAFLLHFDEDTIDLAEFLNAILDTSDNEGND